jgi:hypothetical protein
MPIHVEGKFTVADIVRGSWPVARKGVLFLTALGVLLLVEAVFLNLKEGSRSSWYLFALGIFLIVYMWPVIFYRSWRQIRKTPNLQGIVQYEFGEDGYRVNASHSTADVKWSAIAKWKEGKHAFIIYANSNFGSLIPKRFFQSSADVDALRGLLQTKTKKS